VTPRNMDAWVRLNRRIGMPPFMRARITPKGWKKIADAHLDMMIYGIGFTETVPDDVELAPVPTFRDWAERTKAIYG
jgi:hypothetical protein